MKSFQVTFCTQKWGRFIRNVKLCKFIKNTLKTDYNGRNFNIVSVLVEHYSNVRFTKFKVQRVVNLFEDTGSVRELNYLAKISRSCFSPLWKNESIQYNKLRPNIVFNFVCISKVRKVNVKYVTCVCAKRGDQNSAIVRFCFIRVYVFASAATCNTVFFFFLANQTSFKDEFLLTAFFIDDQFFDINLK
jgi:hypothetical protein